MEGLRQIHYQFENGDNVYNLHRIEGQHCATSNRDKVTCEDCKQLLVVFITWFRKLVKPCP